jgi:hypothetical protein
VACKINIYEPICTTSNILKTYNLHKTKGLNKNNDCMTAVVRGWVILFQLIPTLFENREFKFFAPTISMVSNRANSI